MKMGDSCLLNRNKAPFGWMLLRYGPILYCNEPPTEKFSERMLDKLPMFWPAPFWHQFIGIFNEAAGGQRRTGGVFVFGGAE